MANALWITLIGMGLFFVAILLLWGLMALLVELTTERKGARSEVSVDEHVAVEEVDPSIAQNRKRRAAAAAVAFAMARRLSEEPEQGVQPIELVTAWQAVNRASQISQRSNSQRKKVVR